MRAFGLTLPLLAIPCVFLALTLGPDRAFGWQTNLDGGHSSQREFPNAVLVDPAGTVIVAGSFPGFNDTGRPCGQFTIAAFAGTDGQPLWRNWVEDPGDSCRTGEAVALALDSGGNVVAAGYVKGNDSDFIVAKLSGQFGFTRWESRIGEGPGGTNEDVARALALDADGDVLAGGQIGGFRPFPWQDEREVFSIVKLSGVDGVEIWRTQIFDGSYRDESVWAITVDPQGDVYAGGSLGSRYDSPAFTVIKLSGADGLERWRRIVEPNSAGSARAVALDASGDLIAAGRSGGGRVVKLSGSDGSILWSTRLGRGDTDSKPMVLDSAGDVIVADVVQGDFSVAKLSGSDGRLLWTYVLDGGNLQQNSYQERAEAVAVGADDNVVAVGTVSRPAIRHGMVAVKLSPDGQELWRVELNGTDNDESDWGVEHGRAVALFPNGDVAAAGVLKNRASVSPPDLTVARLSGLDGRVERSISGRRLLLREYPDAPFRPQRSLRNE